MIKALARGYGDDRAIYEIDITEGSREPTIAQQAAMSAQLTGMNIGGFQVEYWRKVWNVAFHPRGGTRSTATGATLYDALTDLLDPYRIDIIDNYRRTR